MSKIFFLKETEIKCKKLETTKKNVVSRLKKEFLYFDINISLDEINRCIYVSISKKLIGILKIIVESKTNIKITYSNLPIEQNILALEILEKNLNILDNLIEEKISYREQLKKDRIEMFKDMEKETNKGE